MAQFIPALTFLLDNEDPHRSYSSVADVGGFAIAGINSHSWPVQYSRIVSLPQDERPTAVAEFYRLNFWNPLELDAIESQAIANRVMDCGVNEGMGTATRTLQQAAVEQGATIAVDGVLGPNTLAVVNGCDESALLNSFRALRADRYRRIAKANPGSAQYLTGWLQRASL